MKLAFGILDEMIEELKERLIREVRIEPLVDRTYAKDAKGSMIGGIAHIKVYTSVEAIIDPEIPARRPYPVVAFFDSYVYRGLEPIEQGKQDELYEKNVERATRLKAQLEREGFTVRSGHYVE